MVKKIGILLMIACVAASAFAAGAREVTASSPYVIGVAAPITGDQAEYGEYFRSGATLAVKLVNDKGGINGITVELLIEDSKSDPREAVLIAQRFISNPAVVGVVGDFNSSASMAAAQIYSPAGLVQISPTASHPAFTSIGPYIFRAGTTQEHEAAFLAHWSVKDLGRKRIAVLYINNDWGAVTQEIYVRTAREDGAQIVALEQFIPGDRDFTASITKIKNENPDFFFIGAQWAEAALIATQAQRLGLNVDLMGAGTLSTDTLIQNAGMAVEGLRANAQFFVGDTRPPSAYFETEYRKLYPNVRPHGHAALTFDSVNLLIEVIKVGGRDRTKIRDAIAAIKDFPGATGVLTFDQYRNPFKSFVKIRIINQAWQVSPE